MIDDSTVSRFVVLTPFQTPLKYFQRVIEEGVATDVYKSFNLSTGRTRELTKEDLALSPELFNRQTLVVELWSPVLAEVRLGAPRKDDYIQDSSCREWTVHLVLEEFHQQVFTCICVKRVS